MTERPIKQRPEYYVHADGAVIYVPRQAAVWLDEHVNFERLRDLTRVKEPEVWAVLVALRVSAMSGSGTGTTHGTDRKPTAELAAKSKSMTTTEVAEQLAVTPRAVCKAIAAQRLHAEKQNGAWVVDRQDFQHYAAARAA